MVQRHNHHLLIQKYKFKPNNIKVKLPVADPSVVNTCTVISDDDGLLRATVTCTTPLFSSVLYTDWSKSNVATI